MPELKKAKPLPMLKAVDFHKQLSIHNAHSDWNGSTHGYSLSLRPDLLSIWAEASALLIPKTLGDRTPIFCYRGISGIGMGTALILAYMKHSRNFGIVVTRKKNDKHHGYDQEVSLTKATPAKEWVLVFVDDCVDSGGTRKQVVADTMKSFELHDQYKVYENQYVPRVENTYFVQVLKDGVCTVPWSILK